MLEISHNLAWQDTGATFAAQSKYQELFTASAYKNFQTFLGSTLEYNCNMWPDKYSWCALTIWFNYMYPSKPDDVIKMGL